MPVFRCKVGDESGKLDEKEIEASDSKQLRERLEQEGLYVYEIKQKGTFQFAVPSFSGLKKISTDEFLVFNQQLMALLKAGLPLLSSLETLASQEETPHFQKILTSVAKEVKEGAPFSSAVEDYPRVFSKLYVSSLRAGEKSGDLVLNISRYIAYTKRVEELKKKVITASVYPLILLTVATFVILFLLLYVVPSFSQVFLDAGTSLPTPTRILIAFTGLVKNNVIFLSILFMALYPVFMFARKNQNLRRKMDKLKLNIPWVGKIIHRYAVAKFCRTLSTILKSGDPLVSAIPLAAGTLENSYMEESVVDASKRVREGVGLSQAMADAKLMPAMALKMINVGESSGSLEEMFDNVADLFEEEVDRKLNILTSTIEPLLMLSMGLIVAFIVVAMYLPIFKLAETVR